MNMLAKLPARRWWYLMPIIFITYSLAYLDRANYGFAAAAGIEHDTDRFYSLFCRCLV